MNAHLYALLACPRCGSSPLPEAKLCPGCGRSVITPAGGLDMIDDEHREEADLFSAQYQVLRAQEGWVGPHGREDPTGGSPKLWAGRLESMSRAAKVLGSLGPRPVILDVGAVGGWAARFLPGAEVIAIDLLDVAPSSTLTVRADMRRLPLRDGTVDAALYAASLHYAPLADSIAEAGRAVRKGGLLIAVDSPIYADVRAQAGAKARSASYYADAKWPALVDHYHPIEEQDLRETLTRTGFAIDQFKVPSQAARVLHRMANRPPATLVVARRVR